MFSHRKYTNLSSAKLEFLINSVQIPLKSNQNFVEILQPFPEAAATGFLLKKLCLTLLLDSVFNKVAGFAATEVFKLKF